MARAKRTDRAEARRRHRAATAEADGAVGSEAISGPAPRASGVSTSGRRCPRPAAACRWAPRSGSHSIPSTCVPTSPPCPGWSRTPTRSGCRSSSPSRAASRSPWPTTRARSRASCTNTSSGRRPSAACSSQASWRLGRAGCCGLIVGLVSALVNALLVTFVPPGDLLDGPGCGPGTGVHRHRRSCSHRSSGRCSRPVPRGTAVSCELVEPEPRPPRRGEEVERRQVTHDGQGQQGRRSPLTDIRERPENRLRVSGQPAHPGVAHAGGRPRGRRPGDPCRDLGQWPDLAGDHVDHGALPLEVAVHQQQGVPPDHASKPCHVSGQSVTLTIPVSSSSARKTVPLAVIGCCRVTTSPPSRTGPVRRSGRTRSGPPRARPARHGTTRPPGDGHRAR